MPNFPPVNEQMDAIRRDALEVIPEEDLARKLARSRSTGERLRIKQGFDPTRPDLHIGHAVSMRKLHTFQELGHDVIFVVGDYTARIGDPSGRSETRPRLTPEEISANATTYAEQVGHILDMTKVRLEYNSSWLAPLDLAKLLELTSTYTVARMLERDDFAKRYEEHRPIAVSEFMYPLMQAYDSVALNADVELGGSDQKFNLLVGRTVQERYGQEPQVCLIMPLLRGTDGVAKMSKSYDNYVGIAQAPNDQYGRTMSIPDDLLDEWTRMAGPLSASDLEDAVTLAKTDPYRAKRALAKRIVALYHGDEEGAKAEAHFDRVYREHATPEDVPEQTLTGITSITIPKLLVALGLAASGSEAGRLVQSGGVRIDEETITDRNAQITPQPGQSVLVSRGKRQFVRVTFQ